jgi:signal transduction histidine kinase
VLIRVQDTGVGVPSSELVRIFDRFHQVDPSSRRRYGGMGLGLSLVRSIVEAHRGAVWAESEEGMGSSFFVWLPRSAAVREAAEAQPSDRLESAGVGRGAVGEG